METKHALPASKEIVRKMIKDYERWTELNRKKQCSSLTEKETIEWCKLRAMRSVVLN